MGMAVGMAMAEAHLESVFNKENYPVVDHYTYVLGGDGCMMEGISSEAFSLAGTLGLSKLIVLYDSNRISIEGSTDIAFTENVQERMAAFGFQTLDVADGNNLEEIGKAIEEANVALVPGDCFGTEGHIRLSYCVSDKDLDEGLRRLSTFLSTL